MSLLKSKGLKRFITSALAVVTFASTFIPSLAPFVEILRGVTGGLGGVALVHAGSAGTLLSYKTGSLASLFSFLLGILAYVPGGETLVLALEWLAGLFGISAVGAKTIK